MKSRKIYEKKINYREDFPLSRYTATKWKANYDNFYLVVYTASAVPVTSDYSENRVYPRYIEFTNGEGVMHTVDLEAEPDMDLLDEIQRDPANNRYLLYTR